MDRRFSYLARGFMVLAVVLSACGGGAASTAKPAATTAPAATATKAAVASTTAPSATPATPTAAPILTPTVAAAQVKRGGTLTVPINSTPRNLHPIYTTGSNAAAITNGVAYSGLMRWDIINDKVVPDLAESYDVSADGTVYTFHLRKGIKFHSGDDMTADDAAYSLGLAFKPPAGKTAPRQGLLSTVKSVDAPDPYTVRATLKFPTASFIFGIASGWHQVLNKKAIESGKLNPDLATDGTGPFKLTNLQSGVGAFLERNPNYFRLGLPYLDKLEEPVITDPNAAFAAFQTGKVPFSNLSDDHIKAMSGPIGSGQLIVKDLPGFGLSDVRFNNTKAPFNDVRVRKAFSMVLDPWELEKTIGGHGAPRVQSGPWSLPDAEVAKYPGWRTPTAQDIADAKKLMIDAGYPPGSLKLDLITANYTSSWVPVAQVTQEAWKNSLGVETTIKIQDLATVSATWDKKDYQLGVYSKALEGDDPDFVIGIVFVCDGGRNYTGFCNQDVQKLFSQQQQTSDPAKRKDIVNQIQRILLEQIPEADRNGAARGGRWSWFKGWTNTPRTYDFYQFADSWIDR